MAGVNKVIIVGNLGQDPETKYMPNGDAVVNMSIATSDSWIDKQTGEKKEKTEWHRVVIFSKLAEIAGKYLAKGSKVYLEGKLRTRKWQDQSGQDRYSTEVVLDGFNSTMQMLSAKGENQQQPQAQSNAQQNTQPPAQQAMPQQQQPAPADGGFDDPIPFSTGQFTRTAHHLRRRLK